MYNYSIPCFSATCQEQQESSSGTSLSSSRNNVIAYAAVPQPGNGSVSKQIWINQGIPSSMKQAISMSISVRISSPKGQDLTLFGDALLGNPLILSSYIVFPTMGDLCAFLQLRAHLWDPLTLADPGACDNINNWGGAWASSLFQLLVQIWL